jgi:hypothetical protein
LRQAKAQNGQAKQEMLKPRLKVKLSNGVMQVGHYQIGKTEQKTDDGSDDCGRRAGENRIDTTPADIGVDR